MSRLAGGEPFAVWPRRGQYVLLDRELGRRLRTIVFATQQPDTKGVHVVPTTHGTCLLGPTASDHDDPRDTATDAATLAAVRAGAARLVPATAAAAPIKVFAANRPASDERLRVRLDARVGTLLHATSRSTGVSTAPAVAELALELLRGAGLDAADRRAAVRALPAVPRLRTAPEPERLTEIDPAYGEVVCACEQVSAAEIAAALAGPVGARSVGALRKRTGAGAGRCQGAMCLASMCAAVRRRRGVTVLVVGAGAAGLGAAAALAGRHRVVLVDRLPVPGGCAGADRPDVRARVARAERAGVELALGTTAARWEGGRLLVCAPGDVRWRAAATLVFAGGLRPATAAELGLAGDRPEGVLAASVARRLLETGTPPWRRAVVVGDGADAAEAAALVRAAGGTVAVVGCEPAWADRAWPGWRAAAVAGAPRVTALRIERDGATETLACDVVLLAAQPRPVRNVEGAIADDAAGVVYLQDIAAATFEATAQAAAAVVQRLARGSERA